MEREAAEAERKRKEEEEARERAAQEAAEREAALARMREEKALSLGPEPDKGSDVTQVSPMFLIVLSSFWNAAMSTLDFISLCILHVQFICH